MTKTLWLSYSWKDNSANDVDFIANELEKCGLKVKMDRYVISAGQRLWTQIEKQIVNPAESDAWSIYMTQNSLTSEAVLEEISYAVDRTLSVRGGSFPVIGINPGDVDSSSIPASLRTRLYVDLTNPDWIERIISTVEGRSPHIRKPEVLPVYFKESLLDGFKVLEARPRAGRWHPAFFAVLEEEAYQIGRFMQNPAGRASLDGSVNHGSFVYEDSEGKWVGTLVNHNITPINSMYVQLKGPVSKILVGTLDGDQLGTTYAYVPHR